MTLGDTAVTSPARAMTGIAAILFGPVTSRHASTRATQDKKPATPAKRLTITKQTFSSDLTELNRRGLLQSSQDVAAMVCFQTHAGRMHGVSALSKALAS